MKANGNQYSGRKHDVICLLAKARREIEAARWYRTGLLLPRASVAMLAQARASLASARARIDTAPASTRRRWLCGQ